MTATSNAHSTAGVPAYLLALGKMAWDANDAAELGNLIDPAAFPTKESRDLFRILAVDVPKGATPITLPQAVAANAKHCVPLLDEILGTVGTASWYESNEYLAERVADEGRRCRLERSATQVLEGIREGRPTDAIIERADQQRAAIDSAGGSHTEEFMLRDDSEIESLPAPEWLIEDVLPQDATVTLLGPPESFKSFVALDWCYHIRTGADWHGRKTRVGTVVYLCGEGANALKKRLAALKLFNGFTGSLGVQFITATSSLNDPAKAAALLRAIERKKLEPRLVIIDTLHKFMSGDENSAQDMGLFIRCADQLRHRFACTVVIVHHTGKDESRGARGSSSLRAAVDTEIVCERSAKEMRVVVSCTKQKDAAHFPALTFDALQIGQSLALKPSRPSSERLAGKNLESLLSLQEHDAGSGLTHGEWLEVSGQKKPTFSKSVKYHRTNSYVRLTAGRYAVSEAGAQAISSTRSTSGLLAPSTSPVSSVYSPGFYREPGVDQPPELQLATGTE